MNGTLYRWHGRVYIIRKDKEIVGLIQYMLDWTNPQQAYLFGISIDAACRGQGMGTELLRESLKALAEEGIKEVELTVAPDNVGAVALYEKRFGFFVTVVRNNEYGEGETRLVMKLLLDNFLNQEQ
jgi:ribosomal-protein-alanine N-acetyltransferase